MGAPLLGYFITRSAHGLVVHSRLKCEDLFLNVPTKYYVCILFYCDISYHYKVCPPDRSENINTLMQIFVTTVFNAISKPKASWLKMNICRILLKLAVCFKEDDVAML